VLPLSIADHSTCLYALDGSIALVCLSLPVVSMATLTSALSVYDGATLVACAMTPVNAIRS
jgi:hypothetical protein